jgi:hypothetical protein
MARKFAILASLGGLMIVGPPAGAASIGFQALQPAGLPALHGHIPADVPEFTNRGLIRFWQAHESSPILRNAAIEVQLCTAVTQARDANPVRFDANHPLIGRLLRDEGFFDRALRLYVTHPARFVHFHHHIIPLLRGCALMRQVPPSPPAVSPGGATGPGSSTGNPGPGDIGNGGGSSGPGTVAVPSPSSILLMFFGVASVVARSRFGMIS